MRTLPELCREWGASLDRARVLLRRRPDLAALATKYGTTRVFDEAAARRIRAALEVKVAA